MINQKSILAALRRLFVGAMLGAVLCNILSIATGFFVQFRFYNVHISLPNLSLGALLGMIVWGLRLRPLSATLLCFLLWFVPLATFIGWKFTVELSPAELPLYGRAVLLNASAAGLTGFFLAVCLQRWGPLAEGHTAAVRRPSGKQRRAPVQITLE